MSNSKQFTILKNNVHSCQPDDVSSSNVSQESSDNYYKSDDYDDHVEYGI